MKITIQKFNPTVDAAPCDKEYDVDYWDKMTVLEVIGWINENVERLAFDYSCRGRVCGRCAVMLDDTPVLACITCVTDGQHAIRPLAGHPVQRDLVVDRGEANNRLALRYNRIRSAPITEQEAMTYNMKNKDDIYNMEWCARCLMCTAACPAFASGSQSYVGPAAMLATAFREFDGYDQSDRVIEAVQGGLWNCIMCGRCTEVCPQDEIDHLKYWQELRDRATERGLTAEAVKVPKTDGSIIYASYAGFAES